MAEPAEPHAANRDGPHAANRDGRARRARPLQVVKAVLSAFIGIRRRSAHENDLATLTPLQVIVTGVIAAAVFVLALVTLVRYITG